MNNYNNSIILKIMYVEDSQNQGCLLETPLAVQSLRLHLPMQGMRVRSLVREVRSHMPHGQKNRQHKQCSNKKTLEMVHIKKGFLVCVRASLAAQLVKNPPVIWETLVQFLGSGKSTGEGISYPLQYSWASLVAQLVKNLPAMQEIWV